MTGDLNNQPISGVATFLKKESPVSSVHFSYVEGSAGISVNCTKGGHFLNKSDIKTLSTYLTNWINTGRF